MSALIKLKVVCTTGIKKLSESTQTYVQDMFEVEPVGFTRQACGRGAAAKRFYYRVLFLAPAGVIDYRGNSIEGEEIDAWIRRRPNPKWKPPKDGWVDDVWRPAGGDA